MSDMSVNPKISNKEIRVTVRLPESLVNFIDDECQTLSSEIFKWDRSMYIRKVLVDARDDINVCQNNHKKKKDSRGERDKNNKIDGNEKDAGYDYLLNMTGYSK